MKDQAVSQASYSDFKLIKSRSVAQICLEIPIEQAEAFLKIFGVPQPGAEKPVALALLNMEKQAEKPRKSWAEMSRAQQAGILCADVKFQRWLGEPGEDAAADYIRSECGIKSRQQLASGMGVKRFDEIVSAYRTATGQQAEAR